MTVWYVARGAGLAALILFSATTALGALVSRRGPSPARRYVVQYLHRATAGLGLTVLAVHITAILADSYAGVGWRGALVPLLSGFRPVWVAFGSLAAYLVLAVSVLGLARGRLAATATGARLWRGLHALAYAGWAAAIVHGFFTGTDSDTGWVRAIYVGCLIVVLGCVAVRLLDVRAARGRTAPLSATVPVTVAATAGATR